MKQGIISTKLEELIIRTAFCLLLPFICVNASMAEDLPVLKSEYSHRRYTMHDGLPNLTFRTLHQDKQGLIWMGTLRGFSRFDGFNFKNFLTDSLANSYIIRTRLNGNTYAYSHQSVFVVDKTDNLTTKELSDSLFLCTNNSTFLPDNYLVLNNDYADRSYLAEIDGDTIKDLIYIPQLNKISALCFTCIDNNKFYFPAHKDKCVYVYDLETKQLTSMDFVARAFFRHTELGLLAFDNNGIYSIKNNSYTKLIDIPDNEYFANAFVGRVMETEDGSLLIRAGSWIYSFKNNNLEKLIEVAEMRDFLYDREQNLWIAASDGLYNFFHLNFKNYSLSTGSKITAVAENKGNYWICTENKLYNWSGNKLDKVNFPSQTGGYFFPEILNANNHFYFPYNVGVLIKNKNEFNYAKTKIALNYYFRKIIALPDNEVLVMSIFDLNRLTPEGKLLQTYDEKFMLQREIFDVVTDRSGNWYIAGIEGLSIVRNEKVQLLKSGMTTVVVANKNDKIFTASGGHLNLLREDSLYSIYKFPSLIQAMRFLDNGFLMLTTMKGLYLIDIPTYFVSGKVRYLFYDHHNGFTGMMPEPNSLYSDSKGIVWVLTNNCVVTFDPEKLMRKTFTPNLIIQNFTVSTDNVKWENVKDVSNTKFSYKNKNFKISFIGINYSAVENVRYRYRLLGFQNEWSEPTRQREVTFNNLPPGYYVFEIYADTGTDESRSKTQSIVFSIKPAFWQTTWFFVVSIAFLMVAGIGVALYIQRRKNRLLLEKLRAEKELNELRISSIRLKAIPHFNANVLSAIEYYIANRTKEDAMRILGIYSDFTFKTLSDVDKAARPLSEELAYVKMYLDLEKVRFLDKFDFRINVDDGVDKNIQLPNMILHTYCENAVKHGLMPLKSGGVLTIRVTQHDQTVCVYVEDNGVGRIYADRNPHIHSTKQGLSILNRQIEIYNRFNREKINQRVEDLLNGEKPEGTRFIVEVPVEFTYIS